MIQISNASSNPVQISVNGVDLGPLISGQCRILPQSQKMTITLRPIKASSTKTSTANLSVASTYEVSASEDAQLFVTREKVCFEQDGYYDCFLLSTQNAQIDQVSYGVPDREHVRKRLKRYKLIKTLFIGPLADFAGDFLVDVVLQSGCLGLLGSIAALIGLIIVATAYDLWGDVLLVILALWVGMVIFGIAADRTSDHLLKESGQNVTCALTELDRWCDPEFIAGYFEDPARKPFMGEIER